MVFSLHFSNYNITGNDSEKFDKNGMTFSMVNKSKCSISLVFFNIKWHFGYSALSLNFEWKPQLKIAPIYQVLTK